MAPNLARPRLGRPTTSRAARTVLAILLTLALDMAAARPASAEDAAWTRLDVGEYAPMGFAVSPGNPDLLVVGLYQGTGDVAMLRSTNRGRDWLPVSFGSYPSVSINTVAFDPVNSNVVYAGVMASTGDGKASGRATEELSLQKSVDGGRTWTPVLKDGVYYAIAVCPSDPRVVYAGGQLGGAGLLTVSDDGGGTWRNLSKALGEETVLLIAVHPTNPKVVAVGLDRSLIRSDDGGQSWSKLALPSGVQSVWSVAYNSDGSVLYATSDKGLLSSLDNGKTWQTVRSNQKGEIGAVLTSPTVPSEIYIVQGSYVEGNHMRGSRVYRSADGGRSLAQLGADFDQRGIGGLALDRSDPQTLYAPSDHGLFAYTITAGAGSLPETDEPAGPAGANLWTRLAAPETMPGGITAAPSDPNLLVVRTRDGLLRSTDRGRTWTLAGPRLGGVWESEDRGYWDSWGDKVSIDPQDPRIIYSVLKVEEPYSYGSYGDVYRSTDGGWTWTRVSESLPPPALSKGPLVNPMNPGEVFEAVEVDKGIDVLNHSTDSGKSFSAFPMPPGTERVLDLEFCRGSPQTLYALTDRGLWAYTFGEAQMLPADSVPNLSFFAWILALPTGILAVVAVALVMSIVRVGVDLRKRG